MHRTDPRRLAQQTDLRVGDFQRSWNEHVELARPRIDARSAQRDAKVAERDAKAATHYAGFATDFAYSAIEEAECAVFAAIEHDLSNGLIESTNTMIRVIARFASGSSPPRP